MAEAKTQQWKKIKSHKKVQEALKKVQQKKITFRGRRSLIARTPIFLMIYYQEIFSLFDRGILR
jgi:hypothetical protein